MGSVTVCEALLVLIVYCIYSVVGAALCTLDDSTVQQNVKMRHNVRPPGNTWHEPSNIRVTASKQIHNVLTQRKVQPQCGDFLGALLAAFHLVLCTVSMYNKLQCSTTTLLSYATRYC
jgi:hypothetical protein